MRCEDLVSLTEDREQGRIMTAHLLHSKLKVHDYGLHVPNVSNNLQFTDAERDQTQHE